MSHMQHQGATLSPWRGQQQQVASIPPHLGPQAHLKSHLASREVPVLPLIH